MSWQDTYYMCATFAACAGIISCVISIMLFVRTRPDRLKARIDEALAPQSVRIGAVESQQRKAEQTARENATKHENGMRVLDTDLSNRMKGLHAGMQSMGREVQLRQEAHAVQLTRIATQLEHGVNRVEINGIDHRVTEVAKGVAELNGTVGALTTAVENVENYLRGGNSK